MRNHKIKAVRIVLCILTVAVIIFIFSNSSYNANISSQYSTGVLGLINKCLDALKINVELTDNFVRKSAHFVEYFVLGCLLFFDALLFTNKNNMKFIFACLFGIFISCVDETIQVFSPGRSCQISDVLLDSVAVCIAIVILFFIVRFVSNKKIGKYKNE